MICITDKDLPASFQEADAESRAAQKSCVSVLISLLFATSLGAAATWVSTDFGSVKMIGSIVAAVAIFLAFVLTTVLSLRGYERVWYQGRAVAESIKTRSWSYMMCSEPYTSDLSQPQAKKRFIEDIADIFKEKGPVVLDKSSHGMALQISAVMQQLRIASLTERRDAYLACRVLEQKEWYCQKAKHSSRQERRTFLAIQACQVVSFFVIGYALYERQVTSGSVGFLAALSSSILAWLQLKRYQETAQSYSVAYQELTSIASLGSDIAEESDFAAFVKDSENAISREHTLWVARRVVR